MAFESWLSPIFSPLYHLGAFWAIIILSIVLSLMFSLAQKYLTDQVLMKSLKEQLKSFQDEMRKNKDNHEKLMSIQKEMMSVNLKYMMQSFKPTLYTMIPALILIGFMGGTLAYAPITPDSEFTLIAHFAQNETGSARIVVPDKIQVLNGEFQNISNSATSWKLKAGEGEHILRIEYKDSEVAKKVIVTNVQEYENPVMNTNRKDLISVEVKHAKLTPLGNLSILGWKPGWLALYIILSIIISQLFRKVMNIY